MFACRHCKKFIVDDSDHRDYLGSNYHIACLEKVQTYKRDCYIAKMQLIETRNMIENAVNSVGDENNDKHPLLLEIENQFRSLVNNISWLKKSL